MLIVLNCIYFLYLTPSKSQINPQVIMKNVYLILAAGLFFTSCGPTTVIESDIYRPAPAPAPEVSVSYQSFYDQLSPYGNWISYPGYGYVWMPNAGTDFKPYATNGNWIYTEAGWTWSSNYSWGWAPFHYGRWFYENGYGWMWMPGNEWAPAWVSWRSGGDYYGWAPLGPRVSVDIALSSYEPPAHYWNFVPNRYMGNPVAHNYYVNETQNITIIHQTTIINNYSGTNRERYAYAPGPDVHEVSRVSGTQFTAVPIRQSNTPEERVSGGQYVIYHPQVHTEPAAHSEAGGRPAPPAPAHYQPFSSVQPAANPARTYSQQENNGRPLQENLNNNQPASNTRPGMANSAANPSQPAYNHTSNTPAAAAENPAYNHPHPANSPSSGMPNGGSAQNPAHMNNGTPGQSQNLRAAQANQPPANAPRTANNSSNNPPPAVNHAQNPAKTPAMHNPNNSGQPQPKTGNGDKKPEQKTEEKPKPNAAGQ